MTEKKKDFFCKLKNGKQAKVGPKWCYKNALKATLKSFRDHPEKVGPLERRYVHLLWNPAMQGLVATPHNSLSTLTCPVSHNYDGQTWEAHRHESGKNLQLSPTPKLYIKYRIYVWMLLLMKVELLCWIYNSYLLNRNCFDSLDLKLNFLFLCKKDHYILPCSKEPCLQRLKRSRAWLLLFFAGQSTGLCCLLQSFPDNTVLQHHQVCDWRIWMHAGKRKKSPVRISQTRKVWNMKGWQKVKNLQIPYGGADAAPVAGVACGSNWLHCTQFLK